MSKNRYSVVHRYEGNPLITIDDIPFPCMEEGCFMEYEKKGLEDPRITKIGDVNNVVFSCGAVLEDDGETLKIYYGASDTCICVGTANVNKLMQFCTIGEH